MCTIHFVLPNYRQSISTYQKSKIKLSMLYNFKPFKIYKMAFYILQHCISTNLTKTKYQHLLLSLFTVSLFLKFTTSIFQMYKNSVSKFTTFRILAVTIFKSYTRSTTTNNQTNETSKTVWLQIKNHHANERPFHSACCGPHSLTSL